MKMTRQQAQDEYAFALGFWDWDHLKDETFSNRKVYLKHSENAYDIWVENGGGPNP